MFSAAAVAVSLRALLRTQMVYDFVEERQGLNLLRDKRVIAATADIAGIAISKSEVRQTPLPISKTEL